MRRSLFLREQGVKEKKEYIRIWLKVSKRKKEEKRICTNRLAKRARNKGEKRVQRIWLKVSKRKKEEKRTLCE